MAGERPNYIAMPPSTFDSTNTPQQSPGLPSPRVQHIAGALAPAMSPLDIFAAQSRALAKQLEEQQRNGNRGSRLPPLVVKDGLAKKPQYFRPPSLERRSKSRERKQTGESPVSPDRNKFDIEEPTFRPKSYYPRFSGIDVVPNMPPIPQSRLGSQSQDDQSRLVYRAPEPAADYFADVPRAPSPEAMNYVRPSIESVSRADMNRPKKSFESLSQRSHKSEIDRGLSINSSSSHHSQFSGAHALRPPNPPYARKTPSIRSVDSEDDNTAMTSSSSWEHRKMSSSSGFSAPQSPVASSNQARRSPSLASESSQHGGHRHNKPSYNFSRPMSRDSRPSMDVPSRMSSADDHPRPWPEDDSQSFEGSGFTTGAEDMPHVERPLTPGGSSYVYSKWSLPRGRLLRRSEQIDGPNMTAPSTDSLDAFARSANFITPPRSLDLDRQPARSSIDLVPPRPPPIPASKLQQRHSLTSMNTTDTGSTIKATKHNAKPSEDMTAEDHLNKGIECHENGSVNESTYHFRLAARQNNPTAMLLYALACRHGWGMRANPSEGVNWLRKAMDCASIELAENDAEAPNGQPKDFHGIKARKAQFALSVYELGVSHMNGWGIVQDKSLALRCFEIASSWGDADAMSEAGFCYAQGVGCKKDLKKAAKYYRAAEAKGVSMVGNSWIYKSKYDDDGKISKSKEKNENKEDRSSRSAKQDKDKEKKPRDKSRTRSLFGRKKTVKEDS